MSAGLPRIGVWCSTKTFGESTFAEVRDFARSVESLGFEMLWIPESFGREVMAHAALLLSVTDRLVIGTGIANIWSRDAVAMANGARTLGEAFPGRFVLGIGVSHADSVAQRGGTYQSPIDEMRRYLEAMATAPWSGPEVTCEVPVLLGALGPKMLELAGRSANGAHPYHVTPRHTQQARRLIGKGILAPEQSVLLEVEADRARRLAREHLGRHLKMPAYISSFRRQGYETAELADGGSDRFIDELVAWGDPMTIAARIEEHFTCGADHVALQVVASNLQGTFDGLRELRGAIL